jgi:glycosyltransferase involved in cell wall biosynthesis
MPILHIINALTPDGAENLLANSLSKGGLPEYTDNVLVYLQGSSPLLERIDKRVEVICLNYKGIFDLPRILLQLRKIIKDRKIELVHSHLNPCSFYTHLCCPRIVKQIHTIHTIYSQDTQTSRLKLFLEKNLYLKKKNCNVILLTDYAREDFLRAIHFKGRAFVVNNFIHEDYFKDRPKVYDPVSGNLKIVAAGRLAPLKNFEYLLKTFVYLKDKDIYLDIFGAGNVELYEKQILSTGVKVKMMGHSYQLDKELPKYDLLVFPSKYEGFGLALFEAMASGLPVLASNIDSLKSIAKDNAIYFDLNDPATLAKTIIDIAEGKTDVNEMAERGQEYAKNTVRKDIYIKRLLEIYNQI